MQFLKNLKDYYCVVKPVATAIDILQGVKNCDLGCVMPTIKSLMTNVENVPTSVAVPLNNAILHGFHERLDQYFMHTDFILAAICHPKFKLYWVEDAAAKVRYTNMVETVCTTTTTSATAAESNSDTAQLTDEDHVKFFVLQNSSTSVSSKCFAYAWVTRITV